VGTCCSVSQQQGEKLELIFFYFFFFYIFQGRRVSKFSQPLVGKLCCWFAESSVAGNHASAAASTAATAAVSKLAAAVAAHVRLWIQAPRTNSSSRALSFSERNFAFASRKAQEGNACHVGNSMDPVRSLPQMGFHSGRQDHRSLVVRRFESSTFGLSLSDLS
jgi:hypothetical protein